MILQTGGSALGEISTKSNPRLLACSRAFLVFEILLFVLSPTKRTLKLNISLFILCGFSFFTLPLYGFLLLLKAITIYF